MEVCPVYVYDWHGGAYCSWYALHCLGCIDPVSLDGSCQLQAGCPQTGCGSEAKERGGKGKDHYFDLEHQQHGMKGKCPTPGKEHECRPGAQIIDPEQDEKIRYVRFNDPTGGGGTIDACVCWVRVTPKDFDDGSFPAGTTPEQKARAKSQPGFERGVGCQVVQLLAGIDRSEADGEVAIVPGSLQSKCLTILVHIKGNKWYPYYITLS